MKAEMLRIVRDNATMLPNYTIEILEDDGETWSWIGGHPRDWAFSITFTYWGARFALWWTKRKLRAAKRASNVVYKETFEC